MGPALVAGTDLRIFLEAISVKEVICMYVKCKKSVSADSAVFCEQNFTCLACLLYVYTWA